MPRRARPFIFVVVYLSLLLGGCQGPAGGAPGRAAALTPPAAQSAAFDLPLTYLAPRADGQIDLRLADAAGDRLLATDRDGFASLAWSPDGRLGAAVIAGDGERALLIFDIVGRTARRALSTGAGGRLEYRAAADWSRLLVRREAELWSVPLPAGEATLIVATPGPLAQWDIAGDGRWALLGVEAEGRYVTTLYDMQGGQALEISSMPHPVIEFSADGRWLALVGRAAGETTLRLHVVDLHALPAETATRVIGMGNQIQPALQSQGDALRYFTDDGSWLAYLTDSGGRRLRLRELAGQARPDFPLEANETLGWLLVQPALRRGLLISGLAGEESANFRTRLLYLDYQISVPFLEGFSDAALISEPQSPNVAIDARLADGQRYLALVDMIKGSGRISLRGRMRPLAVDPAGARALVAINLGTMEELHMLDLRNGGAITYMGRSLGGDSRPAVGQFAPAGAAVWAQLWRADGGAGLALSTGAERVARVVAEKVTEAQFSADGAALAFVGEAGDGAGVYTIRADGTDLRYVGAGRSPRWHALP